MLYNEKNSESGDWGIQIPHNRSQNWTTADLEALEDDQWYRYGEHIRFARSAKKTDNKEISCYSQRRELLDWYHLVENLHKVGRSIKRLKQGEAGTIEVYRRDNNLLKRITTLSREESLASPLLSGFSAQVSDLLASN